MFYSKKIFIEIWSFTQKQTSTTYWLNRFHLFLSIVSSQYNWNLWMDLILKCPQAKKEKKSIYEILHLRRGNKWIRIDFSRWRLEKIRTFFKFIWLVVITNFMFNKLTIKILWNQIFQKKKKRKNSFNSSLNVRN